MKPEVILIVVLGVVSLMIVVADDWWKRRLVEKTARRPGRTSTPIRPNGQWSP
jgi:hypothetical protein